MSLDIRQKWNIPELLHSQNHKVWPDVYEDLPAQKIVLITNHQTKNMKIFWSDTNQ